MGTAQFESLVDLINYYQSNPLYGQVHLRIPVTEETIEQMEQGLPLIVEPTTSSSDPTEVKQDGLYLVSDALMGPMGVIYIASQSSFLKLYVY
jgi:hypothetical protein